MTTTSPHGNERHVRSLTTPLCRACDRIASTTLMTRRMDIDGTQTFSGSHGYATLTKLPEGISPLSLPPYPSSCPRAPRGCRPSPDNPSSPSTSSSGGNMVVHPCIYIDNPRIIPLYTLEHEPASSPGTSRRNPRARIIGGSRAPTSSAESSHPQSSSQALILHSDEYPSTTVADTGYQENEC